MSPRKVLLPIALALAVGLVVGCGQMPTSPAPAVQAAASSAQQAAQPDGLIGSLLGGVLKLLFRVLNLVGSLGGSLSNGRWRVEIPANAVSGNATVSLGVASDSSPDCQLEISPVSLNHFSTPVTLTVDCRSIPASTLSTYVIYWYDPAKLVWTQVAGSKVDLASMSVSAPLQHFSCYAVGPAGGRAGW
jgi:hypothetical protein